MTLPKRKRPETKPKPGGNPAQSDRIVLNVIKSRKEMAIWDKDLKREAHLPNPIINKSLKNLLNSGRVRKLIHFLFKDKRHYYIAAEFKLSEEITGGLWYGDDGDLDHTFINALKDMCLRIIRGKKVATADEVYNIIKKSGAVKTEYTSKNIGEILKLMVVDNMIIDVISTGLGEYHSIPVGELCYRCSSRDLKTGAMASIPCGVCPRISKCTPNGPISPTTCVYYTKWLEF